MAFAAKSGDGRCQQVLLFGCMRRMTIRAAGQGGLVPEFRIRETWMHIVVTFQTQLWAGGSQHSGNIPAMRIVAGNTCPGGERPMSKAPLELVLFVALKAKRFGGLHKPRRPSFGRDLMAKLAQIVLCHQAIYSRRRHSSMAVDACLSVQRSMRPDRRNGFCRRFRLLGGKGGPSPHKRRPQ